MTRRPLSTSRAGRGRRSAETAPTRTGLPRSSHRGATFSAAPAQPDADKPWRRRASPLARQALAWWIALVVYGSLYPLSGWTDIGVGPFAYLTAPIPRWLTLFDLITNVLGYLPMGALVVLAVYPRLRGGWAVATGLVTGALLSASMEAIQTYLPTRVASNLDLATNALGALIGAACTAPFVSALLDRGVLRRWRFQWFERPAGKALALILLWPLAQMYPQPFLFSMGDWPSRLWAVMDPSMHVMVTAWLPAAWIDAPAGLASLADSRIWEGVITAIALLGSGLLATLPMRRGAPRVRLIFAWLACTLVLKTGVNALQGTGVIFDWVTGGAVTGVVLGTGVLLLAMRLPHPVRAGLAFAALLLLLVLVNVLPLNPYWSGVQSGWREGQYRHLNDLAQWLSAVWPYVALGWLLGSAENAWLASRGRRG